MVVAGSRDRLSSSSLVGLEWVKMPRAANCQYTILESGPLCPLTAIASFTSCGKLESFRAAEAVDANRTLPKAERGMRNVAHAFLEEKRKAMVDVSAPR